MASPRPAPGRTALIVLAPPGGGGGMLARVLAAAGAALPGDPVAVAAFNDSQLAESSAGWKDPFGARPHDGGAPAEESAAGDVAAARALLRTAEPHQPLLVLSDPRHTRLGPLWTAALKAEGLRPGFIVLVRSPGAAAAALGAEGLTRNRGLLLWASYMLEADRVSRGGPRVSVAFEQLAADPEAELDRIERALGVRLPRRTWDSAAEIEAMLREESPAPARPGLPAALEPLGRLHAHLQAAAQDEPENTDTVAETARWFAGLTEVMGPVVHQVRREAGGAAEPADDANLRRGLEAARGNAQAAAARAEEAEARLSIVQSALTVARRRSVEAETLLQARATEASSGEREARASLAAALAARDDLQDSRRELEERLEAVAGELKAATGELDTAAGERELARQARADLERRHAEAEARAQAALDDLKGLSAEFEDEQARHGEARERLALTGLSNLAAQGRVRELQAQLGETRAELERRRRWLPRLFGLR